MSKTRYFTLGQDHAHRVNNVTLDKNIVVKITSEDPRSRMVELCKTKWAFEYNEKPNMSYYPRGIVDLS